MVDPMKVWRRYEIVSTRGTRGTLLQRLLTFTTARRRAPDGLLDSALKRHHIDLRALMKRDERALCGAASSQSRAFYRYPSK
jgi:hypothetical protein